MSLEEEITLNQFGQGVRSIDELLIHFSQLTEDTQDQYLVDLITLAGQLDPSDSEIKQALGDAPIDRSASFLTMRTYLKKGVISLNMATEELENSYRSLLNLYRITYQRHLALEKGNTSKWQYQDLSSTETVQKIRTRHQELIDEVYHDPGFRGEFTSLAKLRHDRTNRYLTKVQEPFPVQETYFNFISYDEMLTQSVKMYDDRQGRSIAALCNSLSKALAKRYGLVIEEASRLTMDVVARHLQERG